ncbi:O-Glycosyl hydrolases family 17 protein [Klebsormidium nitens]|uniref:O-Glycosyl hydrolases family 17 protein n=1 Tax=Klebsormidium nitens TaxID=105231 RepID=A0A1Y1IGS6_KLENI|nr:O-Glycosyl hydrolases family 17 protein [Klebsormidium nitens]|eukprot:GAQ87936.1 O-Glycosyl hydrolases family 17 protein [Klebsormidium nitens]
MRVNALACLATLALLAGTAQGSLLAALKRDQVRAVPDGLVSKVVGAGGFRGLAVRSTADCLFLRPDSNVSVSLVVPNDYIEQFSELSSPALHEWVEKEVTRPLARGFRVDAVQLGEAPLSEEYGARFYDSMPAALSNLASLVNPLGVGVTVSVSLADLSVSYPPSAGAFSPSVARVLAEALPSAGALSLEAYPFLLALDTDDPATFSFLALEPDAQGFWDDGGGLWYADVLSSLHDAAVYALEALGFGDETVILTTGWPTDGVERATPELAGTFLAGVARWVGAEAGTPKRPGADNSAVFRQLVDSDAAALTEDAPWARRWGIYDSRARSKVNASMVGTYDLVRDVDYEATARKFCVARSDSTDAALIAALSFACNATDCTSVQQHASCYSPPNLRRHASLAFNGYFQDGEQDASKCFFGGVARTVDDDPDQSNPKCGLETGIRLIETSGSASLVADLVGLAILIGILSNLLPARNLLRAACLASFPSRAPSPVRPLRTYSDASACASGMLAQESPRVCMASLRWSILSLVFAAIRTEAGIAPISAEWDSRARSGIVRGDSLPCVAFRKMTGRIYSSGTVV